jgi:hypothetical protein
MDTDKLLELAKKEIAEEKEAQVKLEHLRKIFERFHNVNRKYLDKDAYEKARESIVAISEAMVETVRFLEAEIARLRSKRMKLPLESRNLSEMQKAQARNEVLLKESFEALE